jgi:CBS domain-containing protein
MSIHLVGVGRPAEIRLSGPIRFRGVRRLIGSYDGEGRLDDWSFSRARIECQAGAEARSGSTCLGCSRLMAYTEGPRSDQVRISCLWTHEDPVALRMTTGDLVHVDPDTPCALAVEILEQVDIHRALVVRDDELVGVVCQCELLSGAAAKEAVAAVMSTEIFVISAGATLGEAAAAMSALNVGFLPVVRDELVVGVITRGDLEQVGAPRCRRGVAARP